MPTPFNELELSIYEHLLLIRIKFTGVYKETGNMYLRYKRRSSFRFWIPVIISILALLSSYDVYTNPFIQKVLQSLAQLLKNIMEN